MSAVCIPTTSVKGRGKVDVSYVRQRTMEVSDGTHTRTCRFDIYRFSAIPSDGWTFDHWETYSVYDYGNWHNNVITITSPDEETSLSTDTTSSISLTVVDSVAAPWVIGEDFGTSRYRPYWITKNFYATAVFKRTPTHLLVNSSTVESPAKLVYDPTTNLLVADY